MNLFSRKKNKTGQPKSLQFAQFSKHDEPPVIKVDFSRIRKNETPVARITLSDNGLGIDQDHSKRICNAFIRLNSKTPVKARDLDSPCAKKSQKRHNGSISAAGIINEGITFTLPLPYEQPGKTI